VTIPDRGRGTAPARAALAGNPSDGYGGAVLAVSLDAWRAEAEAESNAAWAIEPANPLVSATLDRFRRECAPAAATTGVRWMTSIPQRVGLGSSSALVIAVTRALSELHGVDLAPARLAEFALAVETEELGIVAGLQDRVVQAYGGLMFMEFEAPPRYERLDRRLLPPLLIAWHEAAAGHSGEVHGSLRDRHRQGDAGVRRAMRDLAATARSARAALLNRDLDRFDECVNATFGLRRELMDLDPFCVEMIETARACGASANYTGSGGAIVAACRDDRQADALQRALLRMGCGVSRGE
jgi:glucuronokinase